MTISRRSFLGWGAGAAGLALLRSQALAQSERIAAPRPNIVLFLIDDMGWTDLACFGSKLYQTPHTDKLAASGMRFPQAYAACCVCSPTRASILTGKSPARLHLTDWIPGHKPKAGAKLEVPKFNAQLPLEEQTIAECLKEAGYATASIGKWHLGGEGFWPTQQGFDVNIGGTNQGQPPSYFSPYKIRTLPDGPPGENITERLTAEAEKFIQDHRNRPFFLYLPHFAVHTPLQAKKEVVARYQAKTQPSDAQKNPVYAAMVESVDDSVGRILAKLEELQISDRTIVIFMSDNGGLIGPTSNVPLRAGKDTLYEGGHRVPMIIRWPGVTKPGSVCDVPAISTDLFPTIIEMARLRANPQTPCDGVSLVPLLRQAGGLQRDALYWHYPHYHPGGATPAGAIREGDHKLIEFFEDGHVELYNLKDDPGEKHDLASAMPERATALRRKLAAWRESVNAQMPTPVK